MSTTVEPPLIGIVMCQTEKDGHPVQTVRNNYMDAVVQAGGVPLALPHALLASPPLCERAMSALDGFLLTGSPSNIEPWHYGESGSEPCVDPGRDRLAFTLITHALGRKKPLLGICRGMQELVVATGGKLWRHLDQQPGLSGHHEDASQPLTQQYAPAHSIALQADGLLSRLTAGELTFEVNSLHHQGVRSPGPHLMTEATASDGLVEAVRVDNHPFALAVQWHPEWQPASSALSRALFAGLIQACRRPPAS